MWVKNLNKYGYENEAGKLVIAHQFDDAREFSEGLSAVKKGNKWGFVDAMGKEVIACKYENVGDFSNGLAPVEKDGKWGFIDVTGKEVIECKYDNAWCFSSKGLARVEKNGKWGYVGANGEEVVSCKYDVNCSILLNIYPYYDDSERLHDDPNKYITKETFGFRYDEKIPRTIQRREAYSILGRNHDNDKNRTKYIEKKKALPKTIEESKEYEENAFSEGLIRVSKNGKWGFINEAGKEVIKCEYDFVDNFHGGLACVHKDSGYGFIDKPGKVVIECKYTRPSAFYEETAPVRKPTPNGVRFGTIDKTGKEVIECKYLTLKPLSDHFEGLYCVQIGSKFGLVDKAGKEVTECKYDGMNATLQFTRAGYIPVQIGNKFGYIDSTGKEIVPCRFIQETARKKLSEYRNKLKNNQQSLKEATDNLGVD